MAGVAGRARTRDERRGQLSGTVDPIAGFTRAPVWTADESAAIADAVLARRAHWIPRTDGFFTLGRSLYLDAADGDPNGYFPYVAPTNALLLSTFGPMYARLRAALAEVLGRPVSFHRSFARPGFHVLLDHVLPHLDQASVHCDLQFLPLRDRPGPLHQGEVMSFTVAFRVPAAGAGLDVWPARWDEGSGVDLSAASAPPSSIGYGVGELLVHDGLTLHRMAPVADVAPGDVRITLQGHGLEIAGVVHLYW